MPFCQHDSFVGIFSGGTLPLYCMGSFGGFYSFVRGVYVGFACCAGILIFLLSSF